MSGLPAPGNKYSVMMACPDDWLTDDIHVKQSVNAAELLLDDGGHRKFCSVSAEVGQDMSP